MSPQTFLHAKWSPLFHPLWIEVLKKPVRLKTIYRGVLYVSRLHIRFEFATFIYGDGKKSAGLSSIGSAVSGSSPHKSP